MRLPYREPSPPNLIKAAFNLLNAVLHVYGARGAAGAGVAADTLDSVGDHLALVRHAAALATAPPALAPPASPQAAALAASARAAASALLAQLLDCLPRLRGGKPGLRQELQAALPLPSLLAAARDRSATRGMLALRLASLVASTRLSDEQEMPSREGSPRGHGGPHAALPPPALATAMLHAALRHGPGMQAALASCAHALERAPALCPSLRAAALEPYHGLALELTVSGTAKEREHGAPRCQHGAELGAPSACYWASLLDGQAPLWAAAMADGRPHVAAALLRSLLLAAPFTPHHVRLLRALLGMRMLAAAPRLEAAHALRGRLRHVQQLSAAVPAAAAADTHWGAGAELAERCVSLTLFRQPAAGGGGGGGGAGSDDDSGGADGGADGGDGGDVGGAQAAHAAHATQAPGLPATRATVRTAYGLRGVYSVCV